MKTESENLILSLIEQTRQHLNFATSLKSKSDKELNWRENPESWSILECIEHLNLYGNYYLPEITDALSRTKTKGESHFKSGVLGNYFANSMLPKEKLNKMKTFKDKNPLNSRLDRSVIDTFIDQQLQLINLLDRSRKVSLNKVKIGISIAKWLKLKLGDTFRFIINHNIRHIKQVERIATKMKIDLDKNRVLKNYS
ncbi:DinB family protein [Negadavirga shengliensis]|uniref:DinB family protein n=1 Tax=Negadavirga shengliensis TaxID=1389218 RepID=A0ABV9T1M2_9BACT